MQENTPQAASSPTKLTSTRLFEAGLWHSRLVILAAVISSLIISFVMFYITSVEIFYLIGSLLDYHSLEYAQRAAMKSKAIGIVISAVDGFLIGAIMLIFSLGLYELFIAKFDLDETTHGSSQILIINSLDDLKDKLAKVILLVLVVMFFEAAIYLKPETTLELLYYSIGIALVSLALYFSHKAFVKTK